jgi:beta-galactosidase
MLLKKKSIVLFISLLITINSFSQQRVKYNFNSAWKVLVKDDSLASQVNYNDAGWKKVNLSTGIAWYRKHFK